jgi:ABC-2 type transport system permease protein
MLKKSIVWYAVFAGCFLVFYGVLTTGCFGYDTRVPDASEVESVAVYTNNEQRQYITVDGKGVQLYPVLKRPESIRTVLQIHKELSGWYRENSYPYTPQSSDGAVLTLDYCLKNGRTLRRSYTADASGYSIGEVSKGHQAITDLLEYKQGNDVAFYLQPADMESFTIGADQQGVQTVTFTDISQKTEMLEALKKYCLEAPSDESQTSSDYPYQVSVKWADNITPNERLRAALGGSSGKIKILSSVYNYRSGDALDAGVHRIRCELERQTLEKERAELLKRAGKKAK